MEFENGRFERRAFKRIQRPFTARFQIASAQASQNWDIVVLREFSSGGMLFNYHEELQIGAQINLSVTFPVFGAPITCGAKVVRVKRIPNSSIYKTAVCFTGMNESTRTLINDAAKTFFSKKT